LQEERKREVNRSETSEKGEIRQNHVSVSPIATPVKASDQSTLGASVPSDPNPSLALPLVVPPSSKPIVPFRISAAQTLSSLEQKFAKLQSDRDALQQSLQGLKDTESVQARGKKHALEMELGMIDSTIALLVEKIGRYRKSAETGK
jgi:hypothetical protein